MSLNSPLTITVVDLPALRTKPSYNKLLKALQNLELPPTTWNGASAQSSTVEVKLESQYLLSIVSSDLNWLEKPNEKSVALSDQRDELWELASKRLAERCGRSGESSVYFDCIRQALSISRAMSHI